MTSPDTHLQKFKVTGLRVQSSEVVSDTFAAADEEEALSLFHAVYGPAPAPYTDLMPDYAEAFSVDCAKEA